MKLFATLALAPVLFLSIGSTAEAKKPKSLSYKKAIAFEESLKKEAVLPIETPKRLYTQPINKDQECKIVTTQDQLDRRNFRAYWDGECKGGYAFGFGRDIAISDTHHTEEITVYAENGDNSNAPSVNYDFVTNTVSYAIMGSRYPASKRFTEIITDDFHGFSIVYTAARVGENGKVETIFSSPLKTEKYLHLIDHNVNYQITNNTASPSVDPAFVKFHYQTKDARTGAEFGVGIAGYGNGMVRHYQIADEDLKEIVLPKEYLEHAAEIEKAIIRAEGDVIQSVEAARELERRYLYKACNGPYAIRGLDDSKATKVCTWRDKFKEPFQIALAKHASELEQMKSTAVSLGQQQQVQAQLAAQQQLLQQQISQQSVQRSLDSLRRSTESLRNNNTQMFNSIMSQPMPQVAPLNLPNDNRVSCISVGRVTNCQ